MGHLSCPICHHGVLPDVQELQQRIASVLSRNLYCPICSDSLLGLPAFHIHLAQHLPLHPDRQIRNNSVQNLKPLEYLGEIQRNAKEQDYMGVQRDTKQHPAMLMKGPLLQGATTQCGAGDLNTVFEENLICKRVFNAEGFPSLEKLDIRDDKLSAEYSPPHNMMDVWARESVSPKSHSLQNKSRTGDENKINRDLSVDKNSCEICGLVFSSKHFLQLHKDIIHKHANCFEVSCKICTCKFGDLESYRNHVRENHSERRYLCEDCPKTFKLKGSLVVHKRMYHDGTPSLCQICNKKFPSHSRREFHERRYHANNVKVNNKGKTTPNGSPSSPQDAQKDSEEDNLSNAHSIQDAKNSLESLIEITKFSKDEPSTEMEATGNDDQFIRNVKNKDLLNKLSRNQSNPDISKFLQNIIPSLAVDSSHINKSNVSASNLSSDFIQNNNLNALVAEPKAAILSKSLNSLSQKVEPPTAILAELITPNHKLQPTVDNSSINNLSSSSAISNDRLQSVMLESPNLFHKSSEQFLASNVISTQFSKSVPHALYNLTNENKYFNNLITSGHMDRPKYSNIQVTSINEEKDNTENAPSFLLVNGYSTMPTHDILTQSFPHTSCTNESFNKIDYLENKSSIFDSHNQESREPIKNCSNFDLNNTNVNVNPIDGNRTTTKGSPEYNSTPVFNVVNVGNDNTDLKDGPAAPPSVEGKQWECDVCKKSFTTKYFLKKHKRLHTGETPYCCGECGKTFTFQQSYHKHILYHSDDKPHSCSYCGRAFKEMSTLHNHVRIHTGEKPFVCETCGKAFRQRVSYLVHLRIHTGVMPYTCTVCGKSFRYKVSMRSHKCEKAGVQNSDTADAGHAILGPNESTQNDDSNHNRPEVRGYQTVGLLSSLGSLSKMEEGPQLLNVQIAPQSSVTLRKMADFSTAPEASASNTMESTDTIFRREDNLGQLNHHLSTIDASALNSSPEESFSSSSSHPQEGKVAPSLPPHAPLTLQSANFSSICSPATTASNVIAISDSPSTTDFIKYISPINEPGMGRAVGMGQHQLLASAPAGDSLALTLAATHPGEDSELDTESFFRNLFK